MLIKAHSSTSAQSQELLDREVRLDHIHGLLDLLRALACFVGETFASDGQKDIVLY